MFQDGWTALMVASEKGRTDVVKLLIKHNADVNARTEVRLHIYITLIEKWGDFCSCMRTSMCVFHYH